MHCAGAGGAIGALVAYSLIFYFNPVGWLCLLILISGLVGSSRMLLRQHDLWQVLAGTLLGVVGGFAGIIFF
jgi:membrane-associated phospholipid phosphatase